jgi:hypothetical protein
MVDKRVDIEPALEVLRAVRNGAEARRRVPSLLVPGGEVMEERIASGPGDVRIVRKIKRGVEQFDGIPPLPALSVPQEVREGAVR